MNKENKEMFKANCAKCAGLCCVALYCAKKDGFPKDKEAGIPCMYLQDNFTCEIHTDLENKQMKGCIGYDCFGAGQHVTQSIYSGKTWKETSMQAQEMFAVFSVVCQLYQIRFYLVETLSMLKKNILCEKIEELVDSNIAVCENDPQTILSFPLEGYRDAVNTIIKYACEIKQEKVQTRGKPFPKEFLGKSFKGKDMSHVDMNGKLLIGCDFSSCTCRGALFLGADTRDANFSNANLSEAYFLSQAQVNVARGNAKTKLPMHLYRPITWK